MSALRIRFATLVAATTVVVATAAAQTQIVAPKNKYSPADDVKLGQQAASEVEQQLPIMRDPQVNGYLNRIGQRLVENIPSEFRHPEFHYSFTGVDVKEINAFALPGGPMFINRGMIERAHNEGEVAGVMAHELSHVALRHGTAQQTKETPYAIGQVLGRVAGSIIGGGWGQVVSAGSQVGFGAAFLRYSRDYERQADLLGTHIMAAAGYDPRDMANVFRTIQQEGGSGAPQWMSDHPDPGNRYEYINAEARFLDITPGLRDAGDFQAVRAYLARLSPAPSTEEATKNRRAGRTTSGDAPDRRLDPSIVGLPDTRVTSYDEGNLFRVSVPSNWHELSGNNTVTFAPEGGYGTVRGNSVFTHGIEIGVGRNESHDLRTATGELIQALRQSNSRLGEPGGYDRTTIGGRTALHTTVTNVSDVTGGREAIDIYTAELGDGSLFYALGVAPRDQYATYGRVFNTVVNSIQFAR